MTLLESQSKTIEVLKEEANIWYFRMLNNNNPLNSYEVELLDKCRDE
jgi:hypothetical protein